MNNDLENYIVMLKEFNETLSKFITMGFDINSSIMEEMFSHYDKLIELAMEIFKDPFKWIEYFVYECEFGNNPLVVLINGRSITLDSIDTFVLFFEEDCQDE